ncbi:hypothetical protein PTSG_03815 [Salpingoeca rosetta]|uniref:Myosin motor domain-containing protein n=1 Tax=Salpingoeca rosetta (strain ATCC 50818 / BSB-021) TaxID=946362 RepID=F2U5G8_SALR5|nr:uncharacterized protein PTSG_03815 [Salpingoeca rosetta]EGD83184.1 hypothetical protein PTSG_03815 [Salpingoeca rosetta]|eukprot:XP_004995548.1 hypothetical protein PTSG_03815 [Salpingoeca rosetta]
MTTPNSRSRDHDDGAGVADSGTLLLRSVENTTPNAQAPAVAKKPTLATMEDVGSTAEWVKQAKQNKQVKKKMTKRKKPVPLPRTPSKKHTTAHSGVKRAAQAQPQQLDTDQVDLVRVVPLDEDTVVEQLKDKFNRGVWYSLAGPTLIAVNPFTDENPIPASTYKALCAEKGDACVPHVYTIAQRALQLLPETAQSQVIVLSGQSGAGKTFSSNLILDYLTHTSSSPSSLHSSPSHPVVEALAASSVLLEAFGNAGTVNNHNSSRFGKFVDLHFSTQSSLTSATMKTYLLEASRVTAQQAGERNFHIFHYMDEDNYAHEHLGMPKDLFAQSRFMPQRKDIGSPAKHHDHAQTHTHALASVVCGMAKASLSQEQQTAILQGVCAVVALGTVDPALVVTSSSPVPSLVHVAQLLDADADTLFAHLKYDRLQCGRECVHKPRSVDAVATTTAALARFLYKRIFACVVRSINDTLSATVTLASKQHQEQSQSTIGLLDIFGFEALRTNALEQLCINFVNERLQRHFVEHMIDAELRVYKTEGLLDSQLLLSPTSDACVQLLSQHSHSIFRLLDEACRLKRRKSQSSQISFAQRCDHVLAAKFKDRFVGPTARQPGTFVIKHYAGAVTYSADDMPTQNKDVNEAVFRALCTEAEVALFRDAWCEPSPSTSATTSSTSATTSSGTPSTASTSSSSTTPRSKHATITAQFVSDINALFRRLCACRVHYIRCLASNSTETQLHFDDNVVRQQLRAGGIVDSLRVFAAGRPVHIRYDEFIAKYKPLLAAAASSATHAKDVVQCALPTLLQLNDMDESERPLFGNTILFLKDNHIIQLNTLLHQVLKQSAVVMQCVVRGFLARRLAAALRVEAEEQRRKQQEEEEEERRRAKEEQEQQQQQQLERLAREEAETRKWQQQQQQQQRWEAGVKPVASEVQRVMNKAQQQQEEVEVEQQCTSEQAVPASLPPQTETITPTWPALPRSVLRNAAFANATPLPPM